VPSYIYHLPNALTRACTPQETRPPPSPSQFQLLQAQLQQQLLQRLQQLQQQLSTKHTDQGPPTIEGGQLLLFLPFFLARLMLLLFDKYDLEFGQMHFAIWTNSSFTP